MRLGCFLVLVLVGCSCPRCPPPALPRSPPRIEASAILVRITGPRGDAEGRVSGIGDSAAWSELMERAGIARWRCHLERSPRWTVFCHRGGTGMPLGAEGPSIRMTVPCSAERDAEGFHGHLELLDDVLVPVTRDMPGGRRHESAIVRMRCAP